MKLRYSFYTIINTVFFIAHTIPLFDQNTTLKESIPYVQLASLPTPIYECTTLENELKHPHIFVKRDDLTGKAENIYGGNKVRKLEFLLGDALQHQAQRIITYGCTGSNHALATACYAYQLGLESLLMLKHQPNSCVVRQNLLLDHYYNAQIKLFSNNKERQEALDNLLETDTNSYFFPTGGSVALGALGYVNAALELKEQIQQGLLPKPDFIYLPIGSCGTTAGLLLGLQLAQLDCHIMAIAVEPDDNPAIFRETTEQLFKETNQLLHQADATIALYDFPEKQITFNKNFEGPHYGVLIPEAQESISLIAATENLIIEGTYSAKAVAALKQDIQEKRITEQHVVLWWNTYCGLDFSHVTSTVDYKNLPNEVHYYFE